MPPEVTEDGEGPGEEDETNLFWAICKLYQIEDGKPTPHGVGTIRLNRFHKGPSEGRHRILYRDQSVIRELRLNLFLFPLLSPKLRGPKDVGMSFLQDQNGQKALQNYIVKFRDGASAEKFVKLIEENRGSD
ncbi:hypothetical protein SARC_15851 [Sphaeroforma arctica JP610]|uniref:RanBD1 domain-containing protein n=1 Tax=Sphaeroforma arctica JP610 TaxID=667725 RepID=A0A0L0F4L1_9EUKA|nr:hypothetical protein SARC_15851 [Sphaeroforma arctica JP610]KNC71607.1 hypothetical protein SARC_15851 [Sphaeroforma arctica JP610]|eukprot:XP_014145509.1 hypothetical protein SARC_15851 [Sphaeroforma arctica JP610]